MAHFTYHKINRKLIEVYKDAAFAGQLVQDSCRPPNGICSPTAYRVWRGQIDGRAVQSPTLSNLKLRIEGKRDVATGHAMIVA